MSCVAACAFAHEGVVSAAVSGVRIHHHTSEWVLRKSEVLYSSSLCAQCPGVPPCDEVCPQHAHYRDEDSGAVLINEDLCVRCRKCVDACPYHACWYSNEVDRIIKCDVCYKNSDGPQCVIACPSEILRLEVIK